MSYFILKNFCACDGLKMTTMMILCLFCHCSCQLDTCLLAPFSSLAGLLSVTLVPYFSCCSFLTRTWLGCRSLAIIHLYFVFTQTPARNFLPPNTQNALPGWKPEVCSNFFYLVSPKPPVFCPTRAESGSYAQILAGWPKKCEVQKM